MIDCTLPDRPRGSDQAKEQLAAINLRACFFNVFNQSSSDLIDQREHEAGSAVADLSRRHGVSEQSVYRWKAKFGGMDVSDAKRLKALEDENAKLKKLLAETMLDNAILKDVTSRKW